MLHLYIDKKFIWELSLRPDKQDEIIYDFISHFLKKVRGVKLTLNTTKEELFQYCEINEYFAWLPEITPSPQLNPKWTEDIELLSKQGSISKLFLLSNEESYEELEQKYGYLYLNNANLIKKWTPVRVMRDVDFISANTAPEKPYWEQLTDVAHPFNSLLVFDNYALSNKANQKLEHNLIPFLNHILSHYCCSKNAKEMVIFSHEILEKDELNNNERIKKAHQILQQEIRRCSSIEVIKYDDTHIKIKAAQKEHDRFIFTNYMYFEAGSGFCVYDAKGEAKSHLKVSIRSIFKNCYRAIIEESLKNLSAYTVTLKEEIQVCPPLKAGELPRRITYTSYFPSKNNSMINNPKCEGRTEPKVTLVTKRISP